MTPVSGTVAAPLPSGSHRLEQARRTPGQGPVAKPARKECGEQNAPPSDRPCSLGPLGALPLASQVLQLPGAWLTLSFGPKVVAVITIGAARLIWLPMVVLPFVRLTTETKLQLFVVVVAAAAILGVLGNNAWTAWMGDLVPGRI